MNNYLIMVPTKKGSIYMAIDKAEEAYQLAFEAANDYDVSEVAIYELKDVGRRSQFVWESQRKEPEAPTSRKHRKWSKGELETLQRHIDKGTPHKKIAKLLGRTDKAIQIRASRLQRGF